MGRVIIAAIIGTIVLFFWGMFSWMVLSWHNETLNKLDNETAVIAFLSQQAPDPGMYAFPYPPDDPEDWSNPESEYTKIHEKGPVGLLTIAAGGPPMPPTMWVFGWIINFLVALIASWLLYLACPSLPRYVQRVAFMMILGLFVGIAADANMWNWMNSPLDFSLVMAADRIVGMLLVGILVAAIVRRRREPSPAAAP